MRDKPGRSITSTGVPSLTTSVSLITALDDRLQIVVIGAGAPPESQHPLGSGEAGGEVGESVTVNDKHREVKVGQDPSLDVRFEEVGLKNSECVGVGGPIGGFCNQTLATGTSRNWPRAFMGAHLPAFRGKLRWSARWPRPVLGSKAHQAGLPSQVSVGENGIASES
jgi:hypothetical protein